MFKKIRIILAAVYFTLITLLFLDFTGTVHVWSSIRKNATATRSAPATARLRVSTPTGTV
jgi:hypothetical protein